MRSVWKGTVWRVRRQLDLGSNCPPWLRPISDLYQAMQDPNRDPFTVELPVCKESETDAYVMHSVLRAWAVNFENMRDRTPFLRLWFRLPEAERRAIIDEGNMVYFYELDVDHWYRRMLERDDVQMWRKSFPLYHALDDDSIASSISKWGGVNCFREFEKHHSRDEFVTLLWSSAALFLAATHGQIPILGEIKRIGEPRFSGQVCVYASSYGQLDTLKYLHENGCPWDNETCYTAKTVDCLRYAHENGCPWNHLATLFAARDGYFDVFQYAYTNGCPINVEECYKITKKKEIRDLLLADHPHLAAEL